jgi:hypothetical protein
MTLRSRHLYCRNRPDRRAVDDDFQYSLIIFPWKRDSPFKSSKLLDSQKNKLSCTDCMKLTGSIILQDCCTRYLERSISQHGLETCRFLLGATCWVALMTTSLGSNSSPAWYGLLMSGVDQHTLMKTRWGLITPETSSEFADTTCFKRDSQLNLKLLT